MADEIEQTLSFNTLGVFIQNSLWLGKVLAFLSFLSPSNLKIILILTQGQ